MDDESNIVEINFKLTDRRLGAKNNCSKEYSCQHRKMLADQDNKVLECESCGFIYTPWEYVWRLATTEDRIYAQLKYAEDKKFELNAELADLKRQVKNAKAQLRRCKS